MQTSFQLPTAVTYNGTGVNGWIDPNNILLIDDLFTVSSGTANILQVGNFNLNIAQGNDITNFTIKVKGYRGSFNTTLQLYAVDATSGVELSYPLAPFQGFSGTNTLYTLPSSLFGTTWTVDQANNIQIKLIADGELHIDAIEIAADYVPVVAPSPVVPPSGQIVVDEFVQGQRFQLASSITSSDLYAFAPSFNLPDGTPIQFADFHGVDALITIDQGVPFAEENVRLTAIDHNYQGTGLVRLSFGTINNRGLKFIYPYDHDINLCNPHDGTAEFVISNSAPFYKRFLRINQIDALVSAPIATYDESVLLDSHTHGFDFQGAGVNVVPDGTDPDKMIVTIPGNGTNPPFVSSSSSATSGASQVSSLSWGHVSSGLNRLLVVQIETEAAQTISGVTFNSIALTQGVTTTNGTLRNEQWYLIAPSVGTYNIVVTLSGAAYITCGAETFNTVDQVSPIGGTQTATGTSLTPSLVLTTTTDNSLVVDSVSTGTLPIVYTVGAGQTTNWSITANPNVRQGASSTEPAGIQPDSVVMSWAITQSIPWAQTALEIKGIAGSTPVISGVTVQDTTPSVTVPNVVKIVFPDGTVTNPALGEADINTTLGKVSNADTTPNYLQSKLNVHSSDGTVTVTTTKTNPGANEILDVDLTNAGTGAAPINASLQSFFFDEFMGGVVAPAPGAVTGDLSWVVSTNGNISKQAGEASHPGIVRLTGDASGNGGGLVLATGSTPTTFGPVNQSNITIEYLVRLGNAGNETIFGLTEGITTSDYSNNTGKLALVSKANVWQGYFVNQSGGSIVTSASTVATTTNWVKLKIVTDGTGANAEFFVDGVSIGTLALIAGSNQTPCCGIIGNTKIVDIDYFYLNQVLTR